MREAGREWDMVGGREQEMVEEVREDGRNEREGSAICFRKFLYLHSKSINSCTW